LQLNLTTISFLCVPLVIAVAAFRGFWQGSFTSSLSALCLGFFVTAPVSHFYIKDSKERFALGAFQISAIVISRLSAKALCSSAETSSNRAGMEQLYE
jgi:K+-sensing histidine kinase KdpD